MGYRSDVGLCLSAKGKEALDAALTEAEKTNPEYAGIKELLDDAHKRVHEESGTVSFYWNDLKWYDNFVEIAFVEDFYTELNTDDYMFIRVGEENDDNEHRGDFWNNPLGMTLVRRIAFD